MGKLIVGVLMLLIPVSYIFWLCMSSTWGFWRTLVAFTVTAVWAVVAVRLMYKGSRKLS